MARIMWGTISLGKMKRLAMMTRLVIIGQSIRIVGLLLDFAYLLINKIIEVYKLVCMGSFIIFH